MDKIFSHPNIMKNVILIFAIVQTFTLFAQPKELRMLMEAATVNLGDSIPFLTDNGYSFEQDYVKAKKKKKKEVDEERIWLRNSANDTVFLISKVDLTISMWMSYDKMVADDIILWFLENMVIFDRFIEGKSNGIMFFNNGIIYVVITSPEETYLQIQL